MTRKDYKITCPSLEQAADILHVRAAVFREELKGAGVDHAAIDRHTRDWDTEEAVESYKLTMCEWIQNPKVFYRVVLLGKTVSGLFVARIGDEANSRNDIRVIQLDKNIRGRGIGRALLEEFDSVANPDVPTRLDVLCRNESAIGFYQHLGFAATGNTLACHIDGQLVQAVEMQKEPRTVLDERT